MIEHSEVVVSTVHPVLGRLYWWYSWGGDTNSPDYYGISGWPQASLRLPKGWREHDYLHWRHRNHLGRVFDEDDEYGDFKEDVIDEETGECEWVLSGGLLDLQQRSGQTVDEFVLWMHRAAWEDIPYVPSDDDDEVY
jgi:hypothetical protein